MRHGYYALPGEPGAEPDAEVVERFTDCINDDLNLPRALAVAWEVLRGDARSTQKRATITRFDRVFGLALEQWTPSEEAVPEEVRALADEREAARKKKNWSEADRLRDQLHAAGWEMEDRPGGYALKRRST